MKELPSWTTLDPAAPPGMAELSGGGHVVGVVATRTAHETGWAPGVASRVAESWSASGIRLILADGALTNPKLHLEVGIENGEGVADALVFGASVRRVARRVEGHEYFVVVAGTVVADAARAMSGGRWEHLCSGFRDAGVMLAVYLDADDPATAIALQEVSHVLVVAGEGEELPSVVTDCGAPVIGVVGLADADIPAVAVDHGVPVAVDDEAGDEGEADELPLLVDDEPTASEDDEPADDFDAEESPIEDDAEAGDEGEADELPLLVDDGSPGFDDDEADVDHEADEPPVQDELDAILEGADGLPIVDDTEAVIFQRAMEAAESEETEAEVAPLEEILEEAEGVRGSGRRTGLLLVLLLVIVGTLAAAWFGYIEIPGITPTGDTATPPPETEPPVVTAPVEAPATEQGPVLGFSVTMAAYGDAASAQALLNPLTRIMPDVLFMVVPVEVNGRSYYRAMAGPATDSADAAALRDRIASATGRDPSDWVLRRTPQAFEMGEMPDLEAAQERVGELRGLDVPAYVLVVDYSDGSSVFRVYAGAYANEAEASLLLRQLADRGLSAAHLSDRKGHLPE